MQGNVLSPSQCPPAFAAGSSLAPAQTGASKRPPSAAIRFALTREHSPTKAIFHPDQLGHRATAPFGPGRVHGRFPDVQPAPSKSEDVLSFLALEGVSGIDDKVRLTRQHSVIEASVGGDYHNTVGV